MRWDAEVRAAIAHWAPHYGVTIDPALVHAVIERESLHGRLPLIALEPDGDHSYGPMMVKSSTAREMGVSDPASLKDPARGILYGVQYLGAQLKAFAPDTARAVSAYNAGPGGSKRLPSGQFRNNAYVVAVLGFFNRFKRAARAAAPMALPLIAFALFLWWRSRRRRATA